ncbi:hypothetical protein TNIN_316711 [Trichonephila inaurata madagascariensis]|uniref:Uncharacterized protein n=1 Tax=Trichonephila inaurata madagascariensis TaxID=2747483 RepID=A0A8X6YW52_9ARAC|nr:hypothetical protein TNIN_316711 [Trichonephila inaurata madagascariensis]
MSKILRYVELVVFNFIVEGARGTLSKWVSPRFISIVGWKRRGGRERGVEMSRMGREARILFPFSSLERVGGKRVSASGANPSSGSKRKTAFFASRPRLPPYSHAPPFGHLWQDVTEQLNKIRKATGVLQGKDLPVGF